MILVILIFCVVFVAFTYVITNYNAHFFHILNVIFFMSAVVSLYGFYIQNQVHVDDKSNRLMDSILKSYYDIEETIAI